MTLVSLRLSKVFKGGTGDHLSLNSYPGLKAAKSFTDELNIKTYYL